MSLSDTMDTGTPCNQTISDTYSSANRCIGRFTCIARKCSNLVSRSMTTHTCHSSPGTWQTSHEIHRYVFPLPLKDVQWMQSSSWLLMLCLDQLARHTLCHMVSNISLHARPPKIPLQVLVQLRTPWMDGVL